MHKSTIMHNLQSLNHLDPNGHDSFKLKFTLIKLKQPLQVDVIAWHHYIIELLIFEMTVGQQFWEDTGYYIKM